MTTLDGMIGRRGRRVTILLEIPDPRGIPDHRKEPVFKFLRGIFPRDRKYVPITAFVKSVILTLLSLGEHTGQTKLEHFLLPAQYEVVVAKHGPEPAFILDGQTIPVSALLKDGKSGFGIDIAGNSNRLYLLQRKDTPEVDNLKELRTLMELHTQKKTPLLTYQCIEETGSLSDYAEVFLSMAVRILDICVEHPTKENLRMALGYLSPVNEKMRIYESLDPGNVAAIATKNLLDVIKTVVNVIIRYKEISDMEVMLDKYLPVPFQRDLRTMYYFVENMKMKAPDAPKLSVLHKKACEALFRFALSYEGKTVHDWELEKWLRGDSSSLDFWLNDSGS